MNINATTMMEKYGLEKDMPLMTAWLDQTHSSDHMPWGEYLLFWSQAKEKFLTKLFGGELIHKFDVNFCKTINELAITMLYSDTFQTAETAFRAALKDLLESFIAKRIPENDESLSDYMADMMMYGNWHRLSNNLPESMSWSERDLFCNIFGTTYTITNYVLRYENLAQN